MMNDLKSGEESALGYPTKLVGKEDTYESLTAQVGGIVLEQKRPRPHWMIGFAVAFLLVMMLFRGH